MQEPQAPKPFTHMISGILLAVVVIYLAINISFVSTCEDMGIRSCAFLSGLPSFDFIPAIRRPVNFIIANGNPGRAALVLEIYSFAWFTGLIALAVMIGLTAFISLRTTEAERRWARQFAAKTYREMPVLTDSRTGLPYSKDDAIRAGVNIFAVVALIAVFEIYWGVYSFHSWSQFQNMVHVRDRDFYAMSIWWSGLLLFSIFFIGLAIKNIVLRMPAVPDIKAPKSPQ